jgi:hypothetical protein
VYIEAGDASHSFLMRTVLTLRRLAIATFRRKIEVFGVVVNSAGQSKARRG